MTTQQIKLQWLVITFCLLGVITVQAQQKDVVYYINLNESNPAIVHEVHKKKLALQYVDNHGVLPAVDMTIYDWKMAKVAQVRLNKERGLNHFVVALEELPVNWDMDKLYRLSMITEGNHKTELTFKLMQPAKTEFAISIRTNPVQFSCESTSAKLMEFYGVIEGGNAPYTAQWFVVNNEKNDFLYQPKEAKVSKAGNTSAIQVDKNPDYYVMLYVTDQCGNLQKKMLHVVCETSKKKIHSVFVEPLNKELLNKNNAIKN